MCCIPSQVDQGAVWCTICSLKCIYLLEKWNDSLKVRWLFVASCTCKDVSKVMQDLLIFFERLCRFDICRRLYGFPVAALVAYPLSPHSALLRLLCSRCEGAGWLYSRTCFTWSFIFIFGSWIAFCHCVWRPTILLGSNNKLTNANIWRCTASATYHTISLVIFWQLWMHYNMSSNTSINHAKFYFFLNLIFKYITRFSNKFLMWFINIHLP